MNATTYAYVLGIYNGSDGLATKAFYDGLLRLGPMGEIACNVFRAKKNSERAKVYRGGNARGSYRQQAYERKRWAMDNLAACLTRQAAGAGITWGWKADPAQPRHNVVLYVDLPTGQVSFHTDARGPGPDYAGAWDGIKGVSTERICAFAGRVIEQAQKEKADG